ncbi:MAG: GAP family protein [Rhodococcus sp. (in: high G+C Gram-positive bacteria)]|uniref:GAP family protein n=1 Tax=Rhodococcus sp. TaxID=1831 RepID=UPI003BB7EAD5
MGTIIGEFLPLAVGVAISPIPIVAAILMLLSANAGSASTGFGIGWVAGIFAATGIVTLLSGAFDTSDAGGSSGSVSWIKVALGALLVVLAVKQWRDRDDRSVPKWMQAIDRLGFPKAAGFGVALAAVNPKNLLLCVSAGLVIGTGGLGTGDAVVALVVFTLIAASSVLVPVVGYAVAAQRLRAPLDTLKQWLQANNHQVMAIVLVIMGAAVIGKGLGGL